jgi:hypothetical protein
MGAFRLEVEAGDMNIDALRAEIASNRAKSTLHAQTRRTQRIIDWTAIRVSIMRGCELIEDYPNAQPASRVLLLSWMADNRPLHTVWQWDGVKPPELVTAYHPDEPAYRHLWTQGYRSRVRPPKPPHKS